MKKTLLILLIVCLFNPFFAEAVEKEEFVNPIFNEVMEPVSDIAWENRVTPTSITIINVEGYKRYQKCKLVENTMETISFHCNEDEEVMTDKEFTEIITFTIVRYDKILKGLLIRKKYGTFKEPVLGEETLIISGEDWKYWRGYNIAEK